MGAVFAFQATGAAGSEKEKIGRRWVRSMGAKIQTLSVLPSSAASPALWVGTTDERIVALDPLTGTPRAATRATGAAVVQFVEGHDGLLQAVHADGVVETITPSNDHQRAGSEPKPR